MNMMLLRSIFAFWSFFFATAAIAAESAPGVKFTVTLSPVGSFEARSNEVSGEAVQRAGGVEASEVTLKIRSLVTGIELRDRHMNEKYFEAAKYPLAVLKNAIGSGGKFKAQLTLHGKTQPIEGEYQLKAGPTAGGWVQATFKTTLSAFGIAEPSYMGVGVEDEVEVTALIPLAPQGRGAVRK